jgi:eukaryotic-like serine/threonine-protein kinase
MPHPLSREFCRPMSGQTFTFDGEDYRLEGHLGDGAVGLVRRAIRVTDQAERAVKFLAPDPKYLDESAFDDVAIRFKREGERGANLDHPHLVKVFAYCENEDGAAFESQEPRNPFLLMEYVRGRQLDNYIRKFLIKSKGHFGIDQNRLHIAIQIANALTELHQARLIHRDVKPANIFVAKTPPNEGFPLVKLGDFGIVKWGDFHASLSTGVLTVTNQKGLGTMKYMSPEQAISPRDITTKSDIYSLGITLFELFTGQILASPHHVYEIMNARLSRGNTVSRFLSMGYRLAPEDEHIATMLLEMFLRGARGRPSIDNVRGHLEWEYERRFDSKWNDDLAESEFSDTWEE